MLTLVLLSVEGQSTPISKFIGSCIVIYFYSKTNQMHECLKFILFWNDTLHVSGGLSVRHQEFKTVHTATDICQTDTAVCLLSSRQQYLFGFTIDVHCQHNVVSGLSLILNYGTHVFKSLRDFLSSSLHGLLSHSVFPVFIFHSL